MRYRVDPMTLADIPRVVEIERLSYPSPWPSSAYRKELQENPTAHYIVAYDTRLASALAAGAPREVSRRVFPPWPLAGRSGASAHPRIAAIVGFAGLWLMVDEAHVTTIAVHPEHRRRGVGELMLATLIERAGEIGAYMVTLEVRVSNTEAQNLYRKYGFREAGIRRRYYSDNDEDALIMWTDPIHSPGYHERFLRLRAELERRLSDDSDEPDHDGDGLRQPGGAEQRSARGGQVGD
jgi:ribosomal-protein-alanine N-acetyltransferase